MALDKLVDSTKLDNSLSASADKIREKTGSSAEIAFDLENETGFADAIDAIPQLDTSDANATAGDIRSGKSGYVNGVKVAGNLSSRSGSDLSASGATVTVPAGIYDAQATKSVASGSATTPATTITKNPSISVNSSTGLITATVSGTESVTPTVSAGYVSSGTAGTITVSGSNTSQLTTQAAQTITPGTTDKTIAAGKYLTGTQTIKGDANLVAANIADGVSIFGVSGTHTGGTDTSDATAAAGDLLSGKTAYASSGKITGTIASQGAQTITPGTSNQTIPAGKYLSGAQTIKGDANLVPENIISGVTIFGVLGTYGSGSTGNLELRAINVQTPPNKVCYKVGDTFNPNGMVVTANYFDDGEAINNVVITDYTYTSTAMTASTTEVTISYTYGGTTKTTTQAVQVFNVGASLNATSWEVISQVARAGLGDVFWDVGDAKAVTLNGDIGAGLSLSNLATYVFILDFNHVDNGTADNNIIFGGFMSALTNGKALCLWPTVTGSKTDGTLCFNMNHWGNYNYGGWKGCDFRYDILGATETQPSGYGAAKTTSCVGYDATTAAITTPVANTLMAALPSDFRSVLRLWSRYMNNTGNSGDTASKVTSVVDAITLLSEYEIFGYRVNANSAEKNYQTQMAFYLNGNDRYRYRHSSTSSTASWWTASPNYSYNSQFVNVSSNYGGYPYNYAATSSYGLAPAFKI